MKIKVKTLDYDGVMSLPRLKHKNPKKQSKLFRIIMKALSAGEMKAVGFEYDEIGMDKLGKGQPALYLMNHSSFTDLQIVGTLLADKSYHIVCTNDGFVAKEGLMRAIGCIPTKKFISDIVLVKDMKYAIDELNSSIVMYPEASYSFDGTETPLPDSLGKCLKLLGVPVVMIRTKGAFLRDPLYNCLQKRDVKVTARVEYLISPEEIKSKKPEELNDILKRAFEYDHFREQVEAGIIINEEFRADGLHRVLYKCPKCGTEGDMKGEGIYITCRSCGDRHVLTEKGMLESAEEDREPEAVKGKRILEAAEEDRAFEYVSDWYKWERELVRQEIEARTYTMELDVDIMMLVDTKSIYKVGSGKLVHNSDGFELTGCDGKLEFKVSSKAMYSLYADYYWYELGDMICIGDAKRQYYCFPVNQEKAIVAKARLATEELYKMKTVQ
ncbi:MAG: 1-acyl-sn-glycerol-3-phosphate acyltransferase [Lachnospiraceae bacterium]|nr:1-acyl-sn-glycerol-3-phosphate acyltransferase [Candidatus Colinaster scatohippi]